MTPQIQLGLRMARVIPLSLPPPKRKSQISVQRLYDVLPAKLYPGDSLGINRRDGAVLKPDAHCGGVFGVILLGWLRVQAALPVRRLSALRTPQPSFPGRSAASGACIAYRSEERRVGKEFRSRGWPYH